MTEHVVLRVCFQKPGGLNNVFVMFSIDGFLAE